MGRGFHERVRDRGDRMEEVNFSRSEGELRKGSQRILNVEGEKERRKEQEESGRVSERVSRRDWRRRVPDDEMRKYWREVRGKEGVEGSGLYWR